MKVGVAYGTAQEQVWLKIDVPEGTTVREAIEKSGVLEQYPEIDLETQRVGIFGAFAKMDKVLEEAQRVEIYRPITADPSVMDNLPPEKDD